MQTQIRASSFRFLRRIYTDSLQFEAHKNK